MPDIKEPIKFTEVKIENLPTQDYSKAKALCNKLALCEYTRVSVNDIDEFLYFISLLTKCESYLLIVKNDEFTSNKINVAKVKK